MNTMQVNNTTHGKARFESLVQRTLAILLIIAMLMSAAPIKAYAAWDYALDAISIGLSASQCFDGEGDTVLDCSLFGLDIVLALLPFVPAGANHASTSVKIGKTVFSKGDDVVDTLKAYKNVDDAIDAGFPILSNIDDLRAGRTTMGRYGTLAKIGNNVTDLERHHLVPQALADALGTKVDDLTAVLVTESFHQSAFTNPLNALVKNFQLANKSYSLAGTNMVKLLRGVYQVYDGNKMLQSAAVIDILKSPAGRAWMKDAGLSLIGINRITNMMNSGKFSATNVDDCAYVTVEDIENAMNDTGFLGLNWNRRNPFSKDKIDITGPDEEINKILEDAVFIPKAPDTGIVKDNTSSIPSHSPATPSQEVQEIIVARNDTPVTDPKQGILNEIVGQNDDQSSGIQTNEHGISVAYPDENGDMVYVDNNELLIDQPTEYDPLPPELIVDEPGVAWAGPPD